MNEELKQSLDIDYMKLLYEDDSVSIVELLVLHEGLNRNRCDISHDVIVRALPSLANKPIWGIPNKKYLRDYSDDFIEHARDEEQEKGILIFGVFPESGVKDCQFIEKDNKTYLKVQAILFKKYSPIAMNILSQRDGNCKISIEILAKGNTIDGILHVDEMFFLSATCLGVDIKEGIEGSSMDVVRFSLDEAIKESNDKYLSFAKEENYKIPQEVKDNAQKGLDLRKEFGRGGTNVGIKMAKYIVSNDDATIDKVKKISKYFPRHSEDNINESNPPSNEYIAWFLWGGDEGWNWSKNVIDKENSQATDIVDSKATIEIDNSKEIKNKEVGKMEDKKIEFSLNSTQIFEIFSSAINSIKYMQGDWKCNKYWTEAYDESFVYLRDCEEGKTYKMPYTLQDNVATIDFENKKCVISGGYMEVGENNEPLTNATKEIDTDKDKDVDDDTTKDTDKDMDELKNKCQEFEAKYSELETKYSELQTNFSEVENKLKMAESEVEKYARNEEEGKMMSLLKEFAHCMSEDEVKTMSEKVKESKFADFEEMVNSKIKEFALKSKEESTKIDNSFKVSFSNFGVEDHYDYEQSNNTEVSIAEKYGIKIK